MPRQTQGHIQDKCLSFLAFTFRGRLSGSDIYCWLFILLSDSGMLIKKVDLNHWFLSADSQKLSWRLSHPEGKWKLCVVVGGDYCLLLFLSQYMDESGGWLFIIWRRMWGQMWGQMWRGWEIPGSSLLCLIPFRSSDFIWSRFLCIVRLICLSQIFSCVEFSLRWA